LWYNKTVQKKNKIFKKIRREEYALANGVLSKNQKLALAGLGIFALLVFVLWAVQLRNNILQPLNQKVASKESVIASGEQCPDGNCSQVEEELKTKDTDNDSLSNWDELNKYNTSPYLEDSDGDGIDDGTEIKNSTDPNCQQGRDCSLAGSLVSGAAAASSTVSTGGTSEVEIIKSNAAILRQALLDSGGFDKETLDKISDEDLLNIYQLAIEEAASSTKQ
jgi:hypothetical protein